MRLITVWFASCKSDQDEDVSSSLVPNLELIGSKNQPSNNKYIPDQWIVLFVHCSWFLKLWRGKGHIFGMNLWNKKEFLQSLGHFLCGYFIPLVWYIQKQSFPSASVASVGYLPCRLMVPLLATCTRGDNKNYQGRRTRDGESAWDVLNSWEGVHESELNACVCLWVAL